MPEMNVGFETVDNKPNLITPAHINLGVVTIEDGLASGGIGALLAEEALRAGITSRVHTIGLPTAFLNHATRDQIVAANRLGPGDVVRDVLDLLGKRA